MLNENPGSIDKKILLSWLDKAFQYYVVTAFQTHKEGEICDFIAIGGVDYTTVCSKAEYHSYTPRLHY